MMKTLPALLEACNRFVALDQPEAPMTLSAEQKEAYPMVGFVIERLSLETMVIAAYDHLACGKKVWITIPDLEKQLKILHPLFNPKDYGHRNVSNLVKAKFLTLFDVRPRPSQQNVQELRRKG